MTCFGKSTLITPRGYTQYENAESTNSGYWHCSFYEGAGGAPLPDGISGYRPRPVVSGAVVGPPGNEGRTSLTCECSPGTGWNDRHKACLVQDEDTKLTVALSGLPETCPSRTGGTAAIELTAKVTQGGRLKAGVVVSFSVDVTPNSGGHEHHDANRPKGNLNGTQGTTDANGEVKLIFIAPEVAGIHLVKASCSGCTNSPAIKEIQVKVPDLLPISPNPPQNADGSYVYALTSVDKIHEGNGRYHKNQY